MKKITKKNILEFAKVISVTYELVKKVYIEDDELVVKNKSGVTVVRTENQRTSITLTADDVAFANRKKIANEEDYEKVSKSLKECKRKEEEIRIGIATGRY